MQQYCEVALKQLRSRKPRKHQSKSRPRYFQPRPKDEGRNKVKVKDLKPKRIKDYLECKISQRSPALLKHLLFK
ncbi:hypothetical protein GQ457_06G012240 [Hibiscus cannabinus]